jgi:rod shape-determining protein MreD
VSGQQAGSGRRLGLAGSALLLALALQLSILPRLPVPGPAPDVVLVVVVALALAFRPAFGAGVGFAGGLALDLAPPADHPLGMWALVLTLVGYVTGFLADDVDRSGTVPLVTTAVAAAAATLAWTGLAILLGDPRVGWLPALAQLPLLVIYDVLIALFLVPAVLALARWADPEVVRP